MGRGFRALRSWPVECGGTARAQKGLRVKSASRPIRARLSEKWETAADGKIAFSQQPIALWGSPGMGRGLRAPHCWPLESGGTARAQKGLPVKSASRPIRARLSEKWETAAGGTCPCRQPFHELVHLATNHALNPFCAPFVRLVGAGCLFVLLGMHARVCERACDIVLPELIARGVLAMGQG